MIGQIAAIFCLLVMLSPLRIAVCADNASTDAPQIILLRNGELIEGRVSQKDDRYVVSITDGEIRLPVRDVDAVCGTVEEAYELQSRRITGQRIEQRLQLADWCLRHDLPGGAAQEITAAMAIDPKDPRVELLDRRLEMLMKSPPEGSSAEAGTHENALSSEANAGGTDTAPEKSAKPAIPISSDDLARLARNLPRGTVESYSVTILPMLLTHCATAGCHGVGSQSDFVLLRPTLGSSTAWRLTLRDLHNTLALVDYQTPANSKLLVKAREPHNSCLTAAIEGEESKQFQQLTAWVLLATQGDSNNRPAAMPASILMPSPQPIAAASSTVQNTTASGAPVINRAALPRGAGWTNTIAPPGKQPPASKSVAAPAQPKPNATVTAPTKSGAAAGANSSIANATKSPVAGGTAAAPVVDPNVKPASATVP